ncbi:UDP-N-acetylglucosamine--N-acetylmuramyl-(pentapeptide) pyrophosphoryl-undecaprenol N-acetylglucosamine transferase, partial [Bifidobacteriaceae bacterium NR003]
NAGKGDYHIAEYLERIDWAFACADLVICRAGAGTVAEISALGLPAVYVPLPIGNGEQRFNAEPVVKAGGAVMVNDCDFSAQWLNLEGIALLEDSKRLQNMRKESWNYGIRNAADVMAKRILEIAKGSRK